MEQNIDNKSPIHTQINITENKGDLNLLPKTRFSKRFEKLKNEIASDIRYEGILSDFEYYNTKLDGKDMASKLEDGGFNEKYILKAAIRMENPLKVVPLIHSTLTPVNFSHSPFCLFLFSSYSSCPLCRVLH